MWDEWVGLFRHLHPEAHPPFSFQGMVMTKLSKPQKLLMGLAVADSSGIHLARALGQKLCSPRRGRLVVLDGPQIGMDVNPGGRRQR